ncbi:DUF6933 domain-containing protein [Winogradskyella sp. PG-2]|uniref:DUF6933 domain-containing protein n=1 Tax=Winogradskyella sp. PG-2 TaxID=754409 RepID=UPI00045874F4|nr:hypothetical protein [Winogradskyella sp. PG-2]BAO76565.1 hypothetical protein WPG_2335 [Winogradskyella sp. PG-2]
MTEIFTTKKLEKIIKKKIDSQTIELENIFGKWNASVLFIAKKKYLIFVNAKTFYSVIIPQFSTKDLDKISELFLENFHAQLNFEKISLDFDLLKQNIGELRFRQTDNDKKVTGIINYYISKIDYLKYDYEIFNSMVIREMTKKLNITPFKQLNWKLPNEVMSEIIKTTSV